MSLWATDWRICVPWSTATARELRLCVTHQRRPRFSPCAGRACLHLPIARWAVSTAVLLTQSTSAVTQGIAPTICSVQAAGGAVYAGLVARSFRITTRRGVRCARDCARAGVLLSAPYPRFSAAPFTAVMVFFAPPSRLRAPIAAAFERVIEVAVGFVSPPRLAFFVLPAARA